MRHEAHLSDHAEAAILVAIDEARGGNVAARDRACELLESTISNLVSDILPKWWVREYADRSTNFLRVCDLHDAVFHALRSTGQQGLVSWSPKRGDLGTFLTMIVRQTLVARATIRARGLRALRLCESGLRTDEERDLVRCSVEVLLPWIHSEVERGLVTWVRADARCSRQEVSELCQEVCLRMLRNEGYLLLWYDARKGLLRSYVRRVAKQTITKTLKGRRCPWLKIPEKLVSLVRPDMVFEPMRSLDSKFDMDVVLAELRTVVRPKAYQIFYSLVVEGLSIEAVCALFNMNPSAVYASKSRTLRKARELCRELDSQHCEVGREELVLQSPGEC